MRIIIIGLILLTSIRAFSQVRKLNSETTIQHVTIFSSGASIQRTASVNIQFGRSEISFEGLSNQLDPQTVKLKADADIILLSVQASKDFLTERKIDQEEKSFIDKTGSLKDKFDMDAKLLDVYKNEEAMLIKNQAIGGQAGVKTAELKEALDLQRQRLTEIYGKELEIQKRLINEQQYLDRFKAQLKEISKKRDSISYIVTALVESKESRVVDFQLLYNVKDAGWYPSYDVRVSEVTKPLSILMNANVFQRSGESWKNISLFLSTGNPSDNATPSPLQPWMLGFYDPSVLFHEQGTPGIVSGRITDDKNEPINGATISIKGGFGATISDVNGFFKLQNISNHRIIEISSAGYHSKEVAAKPGYFTITLEPSTNYLNDVVVTEYSSSLQGDVAGLNVSGNGNKKADVMKMVTVVTQFQPTTTVFKIDEKYSLETDGKTTTIGIKQFDVPAIYDYYSTPKIDQSAFLTTKIINWQDYNLQSGEASLYFEGTYMGKTYIDLGSTTDTLSLSLGKDNGVKVSRKLIKEYSSKKFIGSNRTETKNYEITLRNLKSVPVNITVLDQFPVSTTKEITVDDIKVPDAQIDKETGIANWVINLPADQERKLQIGYSVKYPKDKKVVLE
jgi:Domain of unknown function (DUF4139)/N-terminal domain of unknown function (DUF4140)